MDKSFLVAIGAIVGKCPSEWMQAKQVVDVFSIPPDLPHYMLIDSLLALYGYGPESDSFHRVADSIYSFADLVVLDSAKFVCVARPPNVVPLENELWFKVMIGSDAYYNVMELES